MQWRDNFRFRKDVNNPVVLFFFLIKRLCCTGLREILRGAKNKSSKLASGRSTQWKEEMLTEVERVTLSM